MQRVRLLNAPPPLLLFAFFGVPFFAPFFLFLLSDIQNAPPLNAYCTWHFSFNIPPCPFCSRFLFSTFAFFLLFLPAILLSAFPCHRLLSHFNLVVSIPPSFPLINGNDNETEGSSPSPSLPHASRISNLRRTVFAGSGRTVSSRSPSLWLRPVTAAPPSVSLSVSSVFAGVHEAGSSRWPLRVADSPE